MSTENALDILRSSANNGIVDFEKIKHSITADMIRNLEALGYIKVQYADGEPSLIKL